MVFKVYRFKKDSYNINTINFTNLFIYDKIYKELQKEESYLELGICRSITYKRLESVIKGYKSYKNNNFVEGIQSNLKYLRVKVK